MITIASINSSKPIEHEKTDYTVEDLDRETVLDLFYPITVIQARYGGGYAGGEWTAFANCYRPREETDAFGSDTNCMRFWSSGPRHYVGDGHDQKTVYAVASEEFESTLDNLAEVIREDLEDENVVRVEREVDGGMIGYLKDDTKFRVDKPLTQDLSSTPGDTE